MDNTQETKLCKYCQTEIPKKAKICPNCKKKQSGKGKWIVIAILVLLILAGIGGGSGNSGQNADNKNTNNNAVVQSENKEQEQNISIEQEVAETPQENEPQTDEEEYIEISSTALIDAYNENQVKCKQLYDGKSLRVTGTVISVGTDILDTVYVCLGHDTEYVFIGVQCYAKDEETENKIAELKEGDKITVIGTGDCGSMSFSLKNATIE